MASDGLGPGLPLDSQQPQQAPPQAPRWRPGPIAVAPVRQTSLSGEHDVLGGGSDSGSPAGQGDWRRQRRQRAEELFMHYEGERGAAVFVIVLAGCGT